MGVVGGLLAILFIFLLWRFCISRKARNGAINMDQITPQYHPVPTLPGNGNDVFLNDNSIPMTSDDHYGFGVEKYGLIIVLRPPLLKFLL